MRAAFRSRLRLLLGALILVAVLILVRLYFVQVVYGTDYALQADAQYAAQGATLFDRGAIYFTQKDSTPVAAATLSTGYLVAIDPQTLADPAAAYAAIDTLASSTLIGESDFLADAGKKSQVYIEVAHHLSDSAGKALAAEALPGVSVYRERWRSYPGGSLAAQSVGIVAEDASDDALKGRTGLEAYYESVLARADDALYQNFFAELFSNLGDALVSAKDAKEGNVITTIEPEVEARLESDLAKVNAEYSSQGTGGIIMDPHTGAIIALASAPSFDENDLAGTDPALLRNPLTENVYEFGSIMKPLTMAAGLDAGVITPSSTYDDTGCITVDKAQICNFDLKARGVTPMVSIIELSLNVGASWIATQLGQSAFRSYFTSYFGQKTGIDLPSEQGALLNNLQTTQQVNFDNMSFGQGISVTPIAMLRALSAIANGGVMPRPHLASAIELDSGLDKPLDWSGGTPVFSPAVASEVAQMLETVYPRDARLAINADPSLQYAGVPVAAKTGTAQVEKPGGGYYSDVFFHSFFGFFPANNPRFAILLYTNRPQGVEYASGTLTGTFMDLTNFLIDYYDIPPDPADVLPLPATITE
ncbi:MAG TPA: penicillin-binding protein 2 [Candidatus Paceibacterota bacterium]|nr:penicillin-binding protein 2 [Candidatus Paceibacterota bacterium]